MKARERAIAFTPPTHAESHLRQDGLLIDHQVVDGLKYLRMLQGAQYTESESHPMWLRRKSGVFQGDLGGPFKTTKTYVKDFKGLPVSLGGSYKTTSIPHRLMSADYNGPMWPGSPTVLKYPDFIISSPDEFNVVGATAISRCNPSNPATNALTAIGELFTDGIPHLIGSGLKELRMLTSKEIGKVLGHEYLNVEFGWKPFISDLRSIATAIVNIERNLKIFEQNSGKLVRRRYVFPTVTRSSDKVVVSNVDPWIALDNDPLHFVVNQGTVTPTGQVVCITKTTVKQWFSGAFVYYVPPSDSLRNSIARHVIQARKLLGLSLTPDVVWSLLPWSWMVDWFYDVHELLNNWTNWAIDNQVLAYGYVMEHSIAENTYFYDGKSTFQSNAVTPEPMTLVSEAKIRVAATPFGFGLDWDHFSSQQLSILAALGITRR